MKMKAKTVETSDAASTTTMSTASTYEAFEIEDAVGAAEGGRLSLQSYDPHAILTARTLERHRAQSTMSQRGPLAVSHRAANSTVRVKIKCNNWLKAVLATIMLVAVATALLIAAVYFVASGERCDCSRASLDQGLKSRIADLEAVELASGQIRSAHNITFTVATEGHPAQPLASAPACLQGKVGAVGGGLVTINTCSARDDQQWALTVSGLIRRAGMNPWSCLVRQKGRDMLGLGMGECRSNNSSGVWNYDRKARLIRHGRSSSGLCLAISYVNGLPEPTLQVCQKNAAKQQWSFTSG